MSLFLVDVETSSHLTHIVVVQLVREDYIFIDDLITTL